MTTPVRYKVAHSAFFHGLSSKAIFSVSDGIVPTRAWGAIGWFAGNSADEYAITLENDLRCHLEQQKARWINYLPNAAEIISAIMEGIISVAGRDSVIGGLGVFLHDATESRLFHSIFGNIGFAVQNGQQIEINAESADQNLSAGILSAGIIPKVAVVEIPPGSTIMAFTSGNREQVAGIEANSALGEYMESIAFEDDKLAISSVPANPGFKISGMLVFRQVPISNPLPDGFSGQIQAGLSDDTNSSFSGQLAWLQETCDDIFSALHSEIMESGRQKEITDHLNDLKNRIAAVEHSISAVDTSTASRFTAIESLKNLDECTKRIERSVRAIQETIGKPENLHDYFGNGSSGRYERQQSGNNTLWNTVRGLLASLSDLKSSLKQIKVGGGSGSGPSASSYSIESKMDHLIELLNKRTRLEENNATKPKEKQGNPESKELSKDEWLEEVCKHILGKANFEKSTLKVMLDSYFLELKRWVSDSRNRDTILIKFNSNYFKIRISDIIQKLDTSKLSGKSLPDSKNFAESFLIAIKDKNKILRISVRPIKISQYLHKSIYLQKFLAIITILILLILLVLNYKWRYLNNYSNVSNSDMELIQDTNAKKFAISESFSNESNIDYTLISSPDLKKLISILGSNEKRYIDEIACLKNAITSNMISGSQNRADINVVYLDCSLNLGSRNILIKTGEGISRISDAKLGRLWFQSISGDSGGFLDGVIGKSDLKTFETRYGRDSAALLAAVLDKDWNDNPPLVGNVY